MKLNLFNKNDEASALWPALSKGWEEMKYSIKETVSLQPAAFTSDLLKPSPNYRGTSGLSVSLTFLTLFFKKKKKQTHTFPHRMPQWKENRPSIFRPQFAKNLELFVFFLIKAPHNLKILHVLIIHFPNPKLIAQGPHGKAPLSAGQPQIPP